MPTGGVRSPSGAVVLGELSRGQQEAWVTSRLIREEWTMVRKIISSRLSRSVERRQVLKGATLLGAAGAFPAIFTRRGFAQDKPTLVNSIRSLSNPYHATWNKGGGAFAKSVGCEYVTLVTEGNS